MAEKAKITVMLTSSEGHKDLKDIPFRVVIADG
jgi:hypothetical protein